MYQKARLRLTLWYVVIILCVSVLFSSVIYNIVSRQIEGLVHMQNERLEHFRDRSGDDSQTPRNEPPMLSTEDLMDQQEQLLMTLLITNIGIVVVAGGAGYFLAGKTLRPIQTMIDEQNIFITNSSHELRTPIATMRAEMETSLMEPHITEKETRYLITSNLEELTKLQTLTNDLLRVAKIHISGGDKPFEDIVIHDLINEVVKAMKPLARKKQITIETNNISTVIKGDKKTLTELITILTDNAIKYSPTKSSIHIETVDLGKQIEIKVKDEGIGIPQEDLPFIFDRFYRADKSRSNAEGYGLGLSIAKGIVERHHGTILAEHNEEKGSTFRVRLPIR